MNKQLLLEFESLNIERYGVFDMISQFKSEFSKTSHSHSKEKLRQMLFGFDLDYIIYLKSFFIINQLYHEAGFCRDIEREMLNANENGN